MRSALTFLVGGMLLSACTESPDAITSPAPLAAASARSSGGGPPFVAQSIAVGSAHSCAVFMSGSAWCAGADFLGQLGNGAGDSPSTTPEAVDGATRFVQVDASWDHTCGLTREGEAYCWGMNNRGQLGNGTTTPGDSPVPVAGGLQFKSISAGWTHTCAITDDGTAWCWGARGNAGSMLGAPSTAICQITPTVAQPCATEPVQVFTALKFREIYAGLTSSCGLATDDHIYCWGANDSWIFGDGTATPASTPRIAAPGMSFSTMALGAVAACGIERSGATYCWGGRISVLTGVLGNGTLNSSAVPVAVTGGHRFVSLELSRANNLFTFSCGITEERDAYCWGHNNMGQLGTTITTTGCFFQVARPCTGTPTLVEGGLRFESLAAGSAMVCGITTSRAAYCWGMNHFGQLGTSQPVDTVCLLTTQTAMVSCSNAPLRMAGPRHGRSVSSLRSREFESADDYRIIE